MYCCRSLEQPQKLAQPAQEHQLLRPQEQLSPDRRSSSPDSSNGVLRPDNLPTSLPVSQMPLHTAPLISAPAPADLSQVHEVYVMAAHRGQAHLSSFCFDALMLISTYSPLPGRAFISARSTDTP